MSYLNATGSGKGFEQSGGSYFYIVDANIIPKLLTYGTPTLPSGAGGAWQVGSFTAAAVASLPSHTSTLFTTGRIVRDMGKTLVSAGRTFRKIKGILPTTTTTQGVAVSDTGNAAYSLNSEDAGYLTFYVETTRDGEGVASPAGLVRFM